MKEPRLKDIRVALLRLWGFTGRVLRHFRMNKGLLLAGSVAYNLLLSIVPLFLVLVVGLSHFVDTDSLMRVVEAEMRVLAPGQAQWLAGEIEASLAHRGIVGGLGLVVLLFFGSLAFRMLEDAMSLIFGEHRTETKRSFWVSAGMPYLFMAMLGFGIFLLTTIQTLLEGISGVGVGILGADYTLEAVPTLFVETFSIIGLAVLLALVYKVLPATRISFRRAMAGGVTAALLWDATRRVLVYWFASVSLVNVVYGSLATVIIVLLSAEIGAIIVLLGAQVIADLEDAEAHHRPWYESPDP